MMLYHRSMTESPISRAIAERGVAVGAMLYEFDTPGIMRILQAAGVDFAIFDLEHTGWDAGSLRTLYATGRDTSVYPITRVPRAEYTPVAAALDAGSKGVMAPMVESREDAELLVASAKYPPLGRRGFGVLFSDELVGGPRAMTERANRENVVIAQIETVAGVENAEAIVAVPGVDVVWLGQFDLSLSLGVPGQFDHPDFEAAVDRLLEVYAPPQAARPDGDLDCRRQGPARAGLQRSGLRRRVGVRARAARAAGRAPRTVTLLDLVRALIRAESSDPPGDESRVAALLYRVLTAAGFEVETEEFAPRRHNVVARLRGGGARPHLVFSAHLDCLPVGDGVWLHPPFGADVEGGRVYGRGACDMKSGLAAMVFAAQAVRAAGVPLAGDLVLAFTGGENSNCAGARRLVETRALRDAGALLVSEPSSLDVISAEKAALALRATAAGGEGDMAAFLAGLDAALPADSHPLLGQATVVSRPAGEGAVTLDLRLLPHHDPDAIQAALAHAGGGRVGLDRIDHKPAVVTDPDDPFLATCLAVAGEARGRTLTPCGQPYFSDACALSPGFDLPLVIIGPGEFGGSGATDESCVIADIELAARIYERIALRQLARPG